MIEPAQPEGISLERECGYDGPLRYDGTGGVNVDVRFGRPTANRPPYITPFGTSAHARTTPPPAPAACPPTVAAPDGAPRRRRQDVFSGVLVVLVRRQVVGSQGVSVSCSP